MIGLRMKAEGMRRNAGCGRMKDAGVKRHCNVPRGCFFHPLHPSAFILPESLLLAPVAWSPRGESRNSFRSLGSIKEGTAALPRKPRAAARSLFHLAESRHPHGAVTRVPVPPLSEWSFYLHILKQARWIVRRVLRDPTHFQGPITPASTIAFEPTSERRAAE